MNMPQVNPHSTWAHRNGNTYKVVTIANTESGNQERYPTSVVYVNTHTMKPYTRPLADWHRSMTLIAEGGIMGTDAPEYHAAAGLVIPYRTTTPFKFTLVDVVNALSKAERMYPDTPRAEALLCELNAVSQCESFPVPDGPGTATISTAEQPPLQQISEDDRAVIRFSVRMRDKMKYAREARGRKGWELLCHEDLSAMLHHHVKKGDPVDVANFCMMLSEQRFTILPDDEKAGLANSLDGSEHVRQTVSEQAEYVTSLLRELYDVTADPDNDADSEESIFTAVKHHLAQAAKTPEWDMLTHYVVRARREAAKACRKFPQPNYVLLKIAEEAGEVVKESVHFGEGRQSWDAVEVEIVQLLAMVLRFITEGDQINGIIPPVAKCPQA